MNYNRYYRVTDSGVYIGLMSDYGTIIKESKYYGTITELNENGYTEYV